MALEAAYRDDDAFGTGFDITRLEGLPRPEVFLDRNRAEQADEAWIDAICSDASPFNLKKFFDQPVLYYPGGGRDFCPLWLFSQCAGMRCFVYADYGGGPGSQAGVGGEITLEHLDVHGWDALRPPERPDASPAVPSGYWSVLETEGDRPIVLLYFKADAVQTYRVLWGERGAAPDTIILQDHGFGGNWTTFGAHGVLYRYANPHHLPRLLYVAVEGTYPWPGFEPCSAFGDGEAQDGERRGNRRAIFSRAAR